MVEGAAEGSVVAVAVAAAPLLAAATGKAPHVAAARPRRDLAEAAGAKLLHPRSLVLVTY